MALSELLAAPAESLSSLAGDAAEMACAAEADYRPAIPGSYRACSGSSGAPGPTPTGAADVAQSAFATAFVVWERIVPASRATSALAGDLGYTSYPHRTHRMRS